MRVAQVAPLVDAMAIETTVFFSKEGSDGFARRLSEAGIKGVAINIARPGRGKTTMVRYVVGFPAEILMLYRIFRRERFDLVHVNGSYQLKGAVAGRLAGVPVVWHLNDSGMPGTIKRLFHFIARFCASGFIVSGERVRDFYLEGTGLKRKPCIQIPAPVDTGFFCPNGTNGRPAETNGGREGRPVSRRDIRILTVANVNPWKGYRHFIEMAAALTQTYGNLQFLAAGGVYPSHTGYFSGLKRMIESKGLENIFFLGRRDDVSALLESADIYVCSSLSEASPMSVWEAMSMEKPVVSTDVGDVRRYIRDGENGFIVPVGDVRAMTEKVRALIEDERMRRTFGRRAREVAVRELDVGICAEKHAVFYRRIAAGRKT